MRYYCNEDAKNLVMLEIENRKEALKLYDGIIEVVKKFDGKILNKRFDTALKKVDERLSYNRAYTYFEITMSTFDNRCCTSVKKDDLGYSHTNYISDHELILNTYLETYTHDKDKESLLSEEKINANVLIEALNNGKNQMEEKIIQLENSFGKVEEWKNKLEALQNEIRETMKDIPYIIREYYDINYHVENR